MKEPVKSRLIHWQVYTQVKQEVFAAASNLIGKILGVKAAPIEFGIDGKLRRLHIKHLLQLEIAGVVGADPNQESLVVNPSFSAVPGSNLVVPPSSNYAYNDHGMQWDNSGKNGF